MQHESFVVIAAWYVEDNEGAFSWVKTCMVAACEANYVALQNNRWQNPKAEESTISFSRFSATLTTKGTIVPSYLRLRLLLPHMEKVPLTTRHSAFCLPSCFNVRLFTYIISPLKPHWKHGILRIAGLPSAGLRFQSGQNRKKHELRQRRKNPLN